VYKFCLKVCTKLDIKYAVMILKLFSEQSIIQIECKKYIQTPRIMVHSFISNEVNEYMNHSITVTLILVTSWTVMPLQKNMVFYSSGMFTYRCMVLYHMSGPLPTID
jgi:hypothetical protein